LSTYGKISEMLLKSPQFTAILWTGITFQEFWWWR